jgi:hypothetical protein
MASVDKIKALLGSGLPNETVATATGVTAAYISQLMSDKVFADEIIAMRVQRLSASTERDASIDAVEDDILKRLHSAVKSGMIYRPLDLARVFTIVNSAKRRGVSPQENMVVNNTVVNLTLPAATTREFTTTITPAGEVVEAGGQNLVTMPAHELLKKLVNNAAGPGQRAVYEGVAKYIPANVRQREGAADDI